MSTQTEQDSNIVEKAVDVVEDVINSFSSDTPRKKGRPPKVVDQKMSKQNFAELKLEELNKKGNFEPSQNASIAMSFVASVEDDLTSKEYETIWKKYFYRGSK